MTKTNITTLMLAGALSAGFFLATTPMPAAAETYRSSSAKTLVRKAQSTDEIGLKLDAIKASLQTLSGPKSTKRSQLVSLKRAIAETDALEAALEPVKDSDAAKEAVAAFQTKLNEALKDLEADDKLGNFEIQDLMSRFNQAETLASSVQKKKDDTKSSVISKIG